MKPHHLLILIVAFYGCSSNSKLSSTFGERKYTKGHFWDMPASIPTVTTNSNAIITKTVVPVHITSHKAIMEHKTIQPLLQPKKIITAKHIMPQPIPQIETVHNTSEHISAIQSASPNDDVTDEASSPKKSILGIVFTTVGAAIILLAIGFLLIAVISALIFIPALGILFSILFIFILLAGLTFYVIGIIYCIEAITGQHKLRALAIAGLAIAIGAIVILLSGAIIKF